MRAGSGEVGRRPRTRDNSPIIFVPSHSCALLILFAAVSQISDHRCMPTYGPTSDTEPYAQCATVSVRAQFASRGPMSAVFLHTLTVNRMPSLVCQWSQSTSPTPACAVTGQSRPDAQPLEVFTTSVVAAVSANGGAERRVPGWWAGGGGLAPHLASDGTRRSSEQPVTRT